ncbi:MAG: hypothetical protein GY950_35210 [bacterium]|nr:hypothetical protein [bacterium]
MKNKERNEAVFACHKKGMVQTKIGEIFGLAQSTVSEIVTAMKNGPEFDRPETRGAKARLSEGQKKGLSGILRCPPSEHGHSTWDKWSIRSVIRKEYGVTYHENYICEIMKSINFTSQKPSTRDYRQDAEKVAVFKEGQAPAIKKKRRGKVGG